MPIAQAKAIFESVSKAAEASVVAKFGEYNDLDPVQNAAYDQALFPLLAEYFGDAPLAELLSIV
ncbi:hypothetical protein [Paraburkholderia rhizosphaerae]|uniref:Uncharacterized protein n=1 Tax=Paraburkholderia rhizosphaerae TaxID=480658 RepID=A0A4R8LRB2_9BURK|nr:hypothetical protein [Paraburkholderia rhizosphaerae]TDY48083.1 hypothetical protein BX592_11116 [Paraburkholderia rhizosphaerae]